MKFYDIVDESIVSPGEYLLHEPTHQIVLCGAYVKENGIIRALAQGSLMEDKIENFKKIQLNVRERKERLKSSCKGCGR